MASRDRIWSLRQSKVAHVTPETGHLEDPDADANYDHHVQNRLDTGSHRDVAIDQVQRYSNYDQDNDKIQQRHVQGAPDVRGAIASPIGRLIFDDEPTGPADPTPWRRTTVHGQKLAAGNARFPLGTPFGCFSRASFRKIWPSK
jgi:hypothetical protein